MYTIAILPSNDTHHVNIAHYVVGSYTVAACGSMPARAYRDDAKALRAAKLYSAVSGRASKVLSVEACDWSKSGFSYGVLYSIGTNGSVFDETF